LSIFGVFGEDDKRYSGMTPQYAAKLAALRARTQLEAHDTASALQTCTDTLGMSRDIARASLLGQMLGFSALRFVEPVCRDAIRAATPAQRKSSLTSITRIIEGWPKLAETIHTEMLFGELAFFFDQLPASTRAQLPPEARLKLAPPKKESWIGRIRKRLFGEWARRQHREEMEAIIEAVALPPAEADAANSKIESHDFAFVLAGMDFGGRTSWARMCDHVRESFAYLVRLQAIDSLVQARDKLGRWPTSWVEANIPPPIDPRTGREFTLGWKRDSIMLSSPSDGLRTKTNLEIELR
jgi:hypothetical protein